MANYLVSEPRPANPVLAGLAGYSAIQGIQNAQSLNALRNMEMQNMQRRQSALQQFGQNPEDIDAVMKIDAATGMAAQKFVQGLKADKRQALMDNINIFDRRKGLYISNPEAYAEDYKNVDPEFRKSLMPPDKFAQLTPDQRTQGLFAKEKITSALKTVLTPYQAARLQQSERGLNLREQQAGLTATNIGSQMNYRAQKLGLETERLNRMGQPKSADTEKIRKNVTSELDKNMKWKDMQITYEDAAENQLLSGKTFDHNKGWGRGTEKVPFLQLSPEEQKQVKSDPDFVAKRSKIARGLYDKDRQTRIDAEMKRRTAGASGGAKAQPTGDFYNSFKAALSGPNKAEAIRRAQENYPDYIERAQKEGLL